MGKYDGLREAVGGTSQIANTTQKQSKYDDLKMSMGLIPDTREQELPPEAERSSGSSSWEIQETEPSTTPQPQYGYSTAERPVDSQVDELTVLPPSQQGYSTVKRKETLPGRDIPIIGDGLKFLDYVASNPISEAVAEYTVPDQTMMENGKAVEGTNARRNFLQSSGQEAATGAAAFAGQVAAPFFVPGAGLGAGSMYRPAANQLTSRMPQGLGQTIAREAAIGAPLGFGYEYAQGEGKLDNALMYGAAGAALGGALPAIGRGVQAASAAAGRDLTRAVDKPALGTAVQDFIKRVNAPDVPIAPPNQAITTNVSRAANTALNQAEDSFRRIESPSTGRVEPKNTYYADRLEELFTAAKQEQLPPGREREALEDIWSRMAGPQDPALDQLIELGTPTLKQLERRTPTPDMLSRARTQQVSKEVAGVPLPVKSEFDRGLKFNRGELPRQSRINAEPPPNQKPLTESAGQLKRLNEPILKTEPITRPMADISQPNNPDTILSRLADATKGDQGVGFNAFGKRAGMYDNLSTDTKSQLVSKTGRDPIRPRDAVDTGYRKMVDDLYRFKDYDKTAEKVIGRKLAPSEQTHTLALNSRGSDMITKHILTQDLVDINGNVIGRSLKNATQQIPKKDIVSFEDYQVLRHAMFRMKRGENVYHDRLEMTPDKAAQKVAEYERTNPEFKKISEEMYDFRQNLAKSWLVDTGLLDRKSWDGYLENNPFYVPNTRQFSEVEKASRGGAKKGFGGQNSPLKPAPGSQRKIISPIESDIEHVDQYVKAGKRNQVMQNIVKMAQKDPEAFEGFIEIMPMTDNMKQSELKKINEIIANDGIDGLVLNINEAFDQMFNQAKTAGKKDLANVIAVRFKGEPVYVKVNDAPFLEAITSMTPQAQGVILEFARNTTRIMKLLTTGVNPIFSLTRNLIRDIPMSYVASKTTNNPLRFSYDLLDSVVSILGNKDMYKSFKSLGGGHSSSIAADRNLLAQSKREILPQSNLKTLPARIIGSVENFTNALETAPRLGEFKRLTKAGNNSDDSKIAGLYAANDVTVNFKRRGNVGREIDAFVPYFNAAIQGLDKTIRTFKDQPAAATMKAIAAITVPSLWLYAINHNDPDYKKLDDRTKDMFYLFPNGDGTFTKLPKPREGGVVFGSGIERALRAWKDEDPEAFKGFADTARVAFTPPVLAGLTKPGAFTDKLEAGIVGDSIAGPLSDIKSNKDYAERPIVPEYMKGLSPALQYDERTSKLSRWIGEKINQSPKQLDYLLKSYSGIIGQLAIPLNSEGGSLKKALITQVTADPTYSNSVFSDFYDIKDKLDMAQKDSKQLGKPTKEYDPAAAKFMNGVSDRVGDVRKVMRSIQSQPINASEKEKKLRELQVLMTSIAEDANEKMKAYKKAK